MSTKKVENSTFRIYRENNHVEIVWFPCFPDVYSRRFFAKNSNDVALVILDCVEADNAYLESLSEQAINAKIEQEIAPIMAQDHDMPPVFEYHELTDRDIASIRNNGSISLGIWN